jgi:hypothetical protein
MRLLDLFKRSSSDDDVTNTQVNAVEQGKYLIGDEASLGKIDVYSPTWVYVRSWARERLQALREANDSTSKTDVQTSAIRGEIRAMKDILALPDEQNRRGLLSSEVDNEY